MSAVVCSSNDRVRRLLELHLSHVLRKCVICFADKLKGDTMKGDHAALVQEGKDLIHYSKQGQAFKSQAHSLHIEILQSPWLCELMAFHINLREAKVRPNKAPLKLFEGCSMIFKDEKPTLRCELFDLIKLQIDLTCSVCQIVLYLEVYLCFRGLVILCGVLDYDERQHVFDVSQCSYGFRGNSSRFISTLCNHIHPNYTCTGLSKEP